MLSFLAMAHFLIPSGPILLEARIGPENGVVGSVGNPRGVVQGRWSGWADRG